jgi:RNA polymerase sigma-70 factor (ECF subfamily)
MDTAAAPARVLAAIERSRRRVWALCYRMTGSRADADDLAQESFARAIERSGQCAHDDATGWLLRIATTTCLDHLRGQVVRRRVTALVDALDLPDLPAGEVPGADPECAAILREDVRYAIVVALQHLTPRQRAALVLRDVCGRELQEVGDVLGIDANAAKAVLHRARVALSAARRREDVDVPADRAVVERLAAAIESGALDAVAAVFAEDVWGIADGGGLVQAATKPSVGRRAVVRRWQNAWRKLGGVSIRADVRVLNGEAALVLRLAGAPEVVTAVVHVETAGGAIVALRIDRDPRRTSAFAATN